MHPILSYLWAMVATLGLAACAAGGQEPPPCPADWKAEVIAEAPRIQHPSAICCSPDGRVFVGEDPMDIRVAADQALGRILCFHPDGKVTVFAEKLHAVFGMQYLEGKLYVLHNPKFSVFRDGHGVGKDRVDLIECTNPKPWALDWNDHVPSNFRLAMDGYLYVSIGDKGVYGAVGRDGKGVELHGGGILRLRPDATELEVYCTGTRNTLDVMINAEDEVFTYDNTDEKGWGSRLTHMVDGGYYGYPWDYKPRQPYVLWMMADYGAGAATGTVCYNEDALPADYHGNLFMADFGRREVVRAKIARDGATYKVLSDGKFLYQNLPDFRPVGMALSPDGMSFYVGDWQHRDEKVNTVAGRLWKVTYTGKSLASPQPAWYLPAAMGRPFEASLEDLLKGLSHPAQSVRLTAQRRIVDRGAAAVGPLVALLGDTSAPAHARRHALWALDAIDGGKAGRKAISAILKDFDPSLRLQAARQLGTRRVKEAADSLISLLKDGDAARRFQAATALGRIGGAAAVPALLDALDEKDAFARYAVFTALNRIGRADPRAWKEIAGGLTRRDPVVREGVVFALREAFEEPLVARLAAMPAEARIAALEALAELHHKAAPWNGEWWAYHPVDSPRPLKSMEWAGTPIVLAALRGSLEDPDVRVRRIGVRGVREAGDGASAPQLKRLFPKETDPEIRGGILRALAAFKDPEAGERIAEVLRDAAKNPEVLLDAVWAAKEIGQSTALAEFLRSHPENIEILLKTIQALGRLKAAEAVSSLVEYLGHANEAVRLEALAARVEIGGDGAAGGIVPLLKDPNMKVRKRAIRALGTLRDKKAVPGLMAAFLKEETKFEAVAALAEMPDPRAADAYLFGLGGKNPALRQKCGEALKAIGKEPPRVDKIEPSAYFDFAMKNGGDPARGRKLFNDPNGIGCVKCHRVAGEGGDVGPDLSGIGVQSARKDLVESVLYPSKAVREGYMQTKVLMRSGQVLQGLAKGETPEELTLQDAEGQVHRLRKTEIEQRKLGELSMMPEDLHAGLSLQDFADLISFMESLKQKPDLIK